MIQRNSAVSESIVKTQATSDNISTMATSNQIKAIVAVASEHAENERVLQALRDSKQEKQDEIAVLNTQIADRVAAVADSRARLKDVVDTL